MTMWLIGGGAVLGAWALLSIIGGELTRRTDELQHRARRVRASRAQAAGK